MNKKQATIPPYLLIIISAIALGASRYPNSFGIFAFIAFIPLFRYFDSGRKNKTDLLRAAITFAFVNTVVAYHWVGLVTVPGVIGMIILFSFYYWLVFLYLNRVWHGQEWIKWCGFITMWLSFEFFLFFTEFRFPWLNVGYAMSNFNLLAQIADIGGIHLISFAVLLVNIVLYRVLSGIRSAIYLLIIIFSVWFGYGYYRYNSVEVELANLNVQMMQPSIGLDKFDMSMEDILALYEKQSYYASLSDPDLYIWPEASIPGSPLYPSNIFLRNKLTDIAEKYKLTILLGTTDKRLAPEDYHYPFYYYNTAVLLNYPELKFDDPYYKMYLVPVGERMPYLNIFPFLWKLEFGQANWEFGKELKYYTVKNKDGEEFTFSPQICYEILFPKISNQMARDGVDFIVNLTNDAWFKKSIGTYQHAMMSRIRAIETRTAVIRSANTGHSAVVSPTGKIEVFTKLYDISNFQAPVYITESSSLYVKYLYNLPYIFVIGALFLFFLAKNKD